MNFITRLLILTNLKDKSYNLIFVIIKRFTKIVYYMLEIEVIIEIFDLVKDIINAKV